METSVFIPTKQEFRQIIAETVDSIIAQRIPQIMRQANRKQLMTPRELKDLTGMSFRMQKYHRDTGALVYSQEGRKIFYETTEVEQFISDRKVLLKPEKEVK